MTKLVKSPQLEKSINDFWTKIKNNFVRGKKFTRENIAHRRDIIRGYAYNRASLNSYPFQETAGKSTIFVDVVVGKRYSVFIKTTPPVSTYSVFTKTVGGAQVRVLDFSTSTVSHGYVYGSFNVAERLPEMPRDEKFKLAFSLDSSILEQADGFMMFEIPSNLSYPTDVTEFIPHSVQVGKMIVDKEVKQYYNSSNHEYITATTVDEAIKEVDTELYTRVNKGEDNVIGGKTLIAQGYIPSTKTIDVNFTKAPGTSDTKNDGYDKFFCCEHYSKTQNTNISQLTIGMHESVKVGDIINRINICTAVLSHSGNVYIHSRELLTNGSAVVYEDSTLGFRTNKVITLNINRTLNQGERMMIFVNGANLGVNQNSNQSFSGAYAHSTTGWSFTMTQGHPIGEVIAYTSETKINNMIADVSWSGAPGNIITFHRANGTTKEINIYGQAVPPTPFDLVGQTRTYIAKRTPAITTFTSIGNVDGTSDINLSNQAPTELPIVERFPQVTGEKIEMEGVCWVLCEGQQVTHSVTGAPITLPTSSEGNYTYLCLGR